jgi:hypothetical protein
MKEVAEYRHYADLCRKFSRDIADPVSKRELIEMAAVWTLLASEREAQLREAQELRSAY